MLLFHYAYALCFYFHTTSSHLLRQKRARSAVFHEVFLFTAKKLNIAPMKTLYKQWSAESCCNHCLVTKGCLSVNHESVGSRRCELLAEDRNTRGKSDFVSAEYFSYYDTIVRDLCNEKDSCYPCSCWSAEFYRSPCICRKLHGKMMQHSSSWTRYIAINPFNLKLYGVDKEQKVVMSPETSPFSGSSTTHTKKAVNFIKYRNDGVIFAHGLNNSVFFWSGSKWTTKDFFCRSFDCTDQHVLGIGLATFQLYLQPNDNDTITKVAKGEISRVQEHGKYWYAIGRSCKCIMRHETIPSPTVNKWEILTTNPGASVEFKVAFNDIIYSLHEDQNIYEWYGSENRWIMIYQGPCLAFDVHHLIFCVTSDHKVKSNYGEYVPRPNIHIPFKTFNHTDKTTPYGRGMDENGKSSIKLDLPTNNIALDQFGKGHVLQIGTIEGIVIGDFENSALRNPFGYTTPYFTVSLWFRTTQQSYASGEKAILSNLKMNGFYLALWRVDVHNVRIIVLIRGIKQYVETYVTASNHFYSWTHIVVSWNYDSKCLRVYLNGNITRSSCSTINFNRTSVPTSLRVRVPGIYVSDIAIWYALLLDEQILQLYQSDNTAPDWRKKFNFGSVTESSCEELRRQRPYTSSGYYWIRLNGKMISVYCDMVTDGGGWTQITHWLASKKIYHVANIYEMNLTSSKNSAYTSGHFRHLKTILDFKQFRIRCTKPAYHDRIVDIATTTSSVIDYFTLATTERPYACGGFYPLEEDNSILSERCQEWLDGKFSDPLKVSSGRFFRHLMHIPNVATVDLPEARCDDLQGSDIIFQMYVR